MEFKSTAKPWFCEVISTRPLRRFFTGWLPPRWPNLSLKVRSAQGQTHELMPQADAEDGLLPQTLADVSHRIGHRRRVAGAVGKNNAVGIEGQDRCRRGSGRNHQDLETPGLEMANNIEFDTVVIQDNFSAGTLLPEGLQVSIR